MTDNNHKDEYAKERLIPSIEDLAQREDWPKVRADLRAGLREWWLMRDGLANAR